MGIALSVGIRMGKVGEERRRYNVCDINEGKLMNVRGIPEEFETLMFVIGFVYSVTNLPR